MTMTPAQHWSDNPVAPKPGFILCHQDELSESSGKEFIFHTENQTFRMMVFLVEGRSIAYINSCKHFHGTPLNPNGVGNFLHPENASLIRCGVHGATYALKTGACLSEDCEGESLDPVPTSIIEGQVVIG
ncbi:MAG: Rieske 2Fe-2S domain-containing protein [Magnetococcales bacterium]|nr:Rieske 2Fe-2S domain-containing protein [Magnetococcales bacterium]